MYVSYSLYALTVNLFLLEFWNIYAEVKAKT